VSLKPEGTESVVTFDVGLFSHGTNLNADAKSTLTALGRQLESHVGRINVSVVGHTDDVPLLLGQTYRDNVALGLARAMAVVNHLRATTNLPSNLFSISSFGESLPPYPNDTPDNRLRNRTVVIRISAAKR
jgi:flagellar motor protein MotB